MARLVSSLTNLIFRQNHKNPNFCIRRIGISGGGEEFIQNQEPFGSINHKDQNFIEIAKDVSNFIRWRPRWEQTLVSEFSGVNLSDPNLLCEVLKHQNNAVLRLRFFYWVSSQFGLPNDQSSYNMIFEGLVAESKAANVAKRFLESTKFSPDPSCLELYICCLCENELIDEALEVFDELKRMGWCPKLETWNSVLSDAVQVGRTDVVWKLYDEMTNLGVIGNGETVTCLVKAFCIDDNVSKGYELLRQVLGSGYVPSVAVFNKLVSGLAKEGNYDGVSNVLHTMIAKNCPPEISTYQEIIHWLCKRGMTVEGFRIFNNLKDRGYAPDNVMYTTMIKGLCKINYLGKARRLWFEMIQKGFMPSEDAYMTLIFKYIEVGYFSEARNLYRELCARGCVKFGDINEAQQLGNLQQKGILAESIRSMYHVLEQGNEPSPGALIRLMKRLCVLEEVVVAKTLCRSMKDRGLAPPAVTHDFIIAGLSKKGCVEEGMKWFAIMQKSNLTPRIGTCGRLIDQLCRRDKMDDILLVLGYMLKIGFSDELLFKDVSKGKEIEILSNLKLQTCKKDKILQMQ